MFFIRKFPLLILFSLTSLLAVYGRGNTDMEPVNRAKRIIQTGSSAFLVGDSLYLFPEAPDRVVAMTEGNQGRGFFLGDIDPGISSKTILPKVANMETILALHPDVIILKNFLKQRIGEPLERVGIETIYLNLETPEAWISDLEILGNVFDNPERAKELQEMFRQRIASVESPLTDLSDAQKPRTLLLYWSVRDGVKAVKIPPLSWIQTRMVEMAGGIPVWVDADFSERWTRVGIEQIAVWDPDILLVTAYQVNATDAVNEIMHDPVWSSLRAVKNGNIHAFPADYYSWDQPDARWLLGLQWTASILHPGLFSGINMEDEARIFFRNMFFINDSDFSKYIQPRLTGLN